MGESTYFIYLLYCANGNYYTGYTSDMARRYREHLLGTTKCKYTRSFKPIRIAQYWQVFGNRSVALRIEQFIKKLKRAEKEQLIRAPEQLNYFFSEIMLVPGKIPFLF